MKNDMNFEIIGKIHTPYKDVAPFTPDEKLCDGEFVIELFPEYQKALYKLDRFNYIYVLFYIDKAKQAKLRVHPPYEKAGEVGLFASRSPNRFNPIGLSIVKIKKIKDNKIYISCIDAFNGTPLIDIKPYFKDMDMKTDSNNGWKD